MENRRILILVIVLFLVIIALVSGKLFVKTSTSNLENNSNKVGYVCDKEENCCVKNEDCKYIWYAGGCYTPEYVAKSQKEAEKQGRRNGEAPPRDNVTCTCEYNKCVTRN